jgi:Protein of unknown function (DUF3108)
MDFTRAGYKLSIAVLFASLVAPAAWAQQAPLSPFNLNGRYKVAWSGITLGRINLIAAEDATSYSMSIDTKTRGVGAIIGDEARLIIARGSKAVDGTYIPAAYESKPQKNEETEDVIKLTYDAKGDIVNRLRTKDDDPAWRPPVPFAKVNTARDPVTGAFMLRRALYALVPSTQNEVATKTYDGLRMATMKMTRAANAKVEVMGEYKDSINVAITRTPIDGYTPKELKKFKKGDPEIRVYFSNDAAFLPVRATAKTLVGELSMTLVGTDAK